MVALWLRLLADGCQSDTWVPLSVLRNMVVATTKVSSARGIRNHVRRAEDLDLLERTRRDGEGWVRLRPLTSPAQLATVQLTLDQARQLVNGTDPFQDTQDGTETPTA